MTVNELLCASLSSLMYPSEWHFLQLAVSLCILCVVVCLGRFFLGDDMGALSSLHPLLLLYFMSIPMWSTSRPKQEKTVCYRKKRSKPKKEEPPLVSEPPKRKPVKEKRKRKKVTDKDNKDSPRVDTYRSQVQTKMYSTLDLYEEIKDEYFLDDKDLYHEFLQYVLTPEQLSKNGFPLDSPDHPGKVIFDKAMTFKQDPTLRQCSRCRGKYYIVEGEKYISDTLCCYHTLRSEPNRLHACCDRLFGSEGCSISQYHVSSEPELDDAIFKKTEAKRQVREDQSCKVYALDCEMLFTTIGMEVAKVGLVDLEGKTFYQTFVLPEHPILDYNTQFSGITANDLKGVNITLADVQNILLKTLNKNTILVGHALQNDLKVLRIIHEKVVDTQVVFHQGSHRQKLKVLVQDFLHKSIQDSAYGHDSIEDARACMELMLWKIKSDLEVRPPAHNENKNSFLQNTSSPFHPAISPVPERYIYIRPNRTIPVPGQLHRYPNTKKTIKYDPKKYYVPHLIFCKNCTPRNSYNLHFEQFFVTEFCYQCDP